MKLSDIFLRQGVTKERVTKTLEAELIGLSLTDKELEALEPGDIGFCDETIEGKDVVVFSYQLSKAYRLRKASMRDIDQLSRVIPCMVVIILPE